MITPQADEKYRCSMIDKYGYNGLYNEQLICLKDSDSYEHGNESLSYGPDRVVKMQLRSIGEKKKILLLFRIIKIADETITKMNIK